MSIIVVFPIYKKITELKLRNNSWKPYVYIVFTTGRPLCHVEKMLGVKS